MLSSPLRNQGGGGVALSVGAWVWGVEDICRGGRGAAVLSAQCGGWGETGKTLERNVLANTHAAPVVCQPLFQVRHVYRLLNPYNHLMMWLVIADGETEVQGACPRHMVRKVGTWKKVPKPGPLFL